MTILQIAVLGILSAVLALTVKKHSPELAIMITIAASVLIIFMIFPVLGAAAGVLDNLSRQLGGHARYIVLIMQILGIAYVAEIAAEICSDAGEGSIAAKIALAGKVMIMAAAAPVVLDVLNMVVGLMP